MHLLIILNDWFLLCERYLLEKMEQVMIIRKYLILFRLLLSLCNLKRNKIGPTLEMEVNIDYVPKI